jgi:hypothetical protein
MIIYIDLGDQDIYCLFTNKCRPYEFSVVTGTGRGDEREKK